MLMENENNLPTVFTGERFTPPDRHFHKLNCRDFKKEKNKPRFLAYQKSSNRKSRRIRVPSKTTPSNCTSATLARSLLAFIIPSLKSYP